MVQVGASTNPCSKRERGLEQKDAAIQLWDTWARGALGETVSAPVARKVEHERRQKELDRLERQCHIMTVRAKKRVETSYQMVAAPDKRAHRLTACAGAFAPDASHSGHMRTAARLL